MKKTLQDTVGVKCRRNSGVKLSWKTKSTSLVHCLKAVVSNFLTRDDNSRITTGKRDTITKKDAKRQRRMLLDSLVSLHAKNPVNSQTGIRRTLPMQEEFAAQAFLRGYKDKDIALRVMYHKPPTLKDAVNQVRTTECNYA